MSESYPKYERRRVSFATEIREAARAYASLPHSHWQRLVWEGAALKPPVDENAYYDAMKLAARQARIARNERDGVALGGAYVKATPETWKRWKREGRELDLTQAIERTQLPHEMTIHERIMPYRVKE
jgi:hypothetical protein